MPWDDSDDSLFDGIGDAVGDIGLWVGWKGLIIIIAVVVIIALILYYT